MSESWLRRIGRSLVGRPAAGTRPPALRAPAAAPAPPGPSHREIVERLRCLVVQQSDGTRSPEDVGEGDHLYERGHLDSMSALALVVFIEDNYRVTIDEADLVGPLCSLDALARHIAAGAVLHP